MGSHEFIAAGAGGVVGLFLIRRRLFDSIRQLSPVDQTHEQRAWP